MFRRAISTTARACQTTGGSSNATTATSSRPLRRTKDPLMSSSQATHYTLPSGSHFIVRPPPSVVPAAYPLGSTTLSNLEDEHEYLLPPSRQPRTSPENAVHLSEAQIDELQTLRRSAPATWTRQALAVKFGISQQVVGRLGWGQGPEARKAEKDYQIKLRQAREDKEARWGWKKAIAREERRRRRAMY